MTIERTTFIKPEKKIVYNKIVNNDRLISLLTKIGALITLEDYYDNSYEDFIAETSKDGPVVKDKINETNKQTLLNFCDLLIENDDTLKENSVSELVDKKFLFEEIKNVFGFSDDNYISYSIYKEIYYLYKFSCVDNFFKNNWDRFVPDVDSEQIDNNEVMKSFVDAIMIEFDKLNNIITNTKDFKSYKDIPYEYLNYLSQLLGFEQQLLSLDENFEEELRIISANIIDVYRIKGTMATFGLLFNLLGFEVEVIQYYFDRRYKFAKSENNETNSYDITDYKYYLSKNNPADNIYSDFSIIETVTDSDLVKPLSFDNFSNLISKYGINCVLGYSDMYEYNGENSFDEKGKRIYNGGVYFYNGPVYTYFKTNIFNLKPVLLNGSRNFSTQQLYILSKLLKFLVPEFWNKKYIVFVDGAGEEDFSINGYRNGKEGFRMLDSEDWLFNYGNDYCLEKDTEEIKKLDDEFEEYQKNLINEKSYRVLEVVSADEEAPKKYVKISDNTYLEEVSENSEAIDGILLKTIGGDKYYICKNNIINYENSLGESDENPRDNTASEKGVKYYAIGSFTSRLGDNEIKIINSTKGAGALMKLNKKKDGNVYKFWKRDSKDGDAYKVWKTDDESTYYEKWIPPKNNIIEMSYPMYDDLNGTYGNKNVTNFVSMWGDSLKKAFLTTNEHIECKQVEGIDDIMKESSYVIREMPNTVWKKLKNDDKTAILVGDIKNIPENNIFIYGEMVNFVKTHNVINYDYINNQLYVSNISIENVNIVFDEDNEYYKFTSNDSILTELIEMSIGDVGSYYLEKKQGNGYYYYTIYKLISSDVEEENDNSLMEYYFSPVNNQNGNLKTVDNFDAMLKNLEDYKKYTHTLFKIKNEPYIYMLKKQPTGKKSITDSSAVTECTGKVLGKNIYEECKVAEQNTNNEFCFYYCYNKYQSENAVSDENSDFNSVQHKRTKKFIAKYKKADKNAVYITSDKSIYKVSSNSLIELKNVACDKIKESNEIVMETYRLNTALDESNDNELTPGIEGNDYVNDNGTLIPGGIKIAKFKYNKEIIGSVEAKECILGLKKIEGNLKGDNLLYTYDNKYSGVSISEDNDNYILNNYERKIKWKNNYEANKANETYYFDIEKNSNRPTRYKTDEKVDGYNDSMLRGIFEDMLGETAGLNRGNKILKWEK